MVLKSKRKRTVGENKKKKMVGKNRTMVERTGDQKGRNGWDKMRTRSGRVS